MAIKKYQRPASKLFPTADVMGALFYYVLSVTPEGEMDNDAFYRVGNFMVGENFGEQIKVKNGKAFRRIIAANILAQHPELAVVDIKELEKIQNKIPFVKAHIDATRHTVTRRAHIFAIKKWVSKQIKKVGAAFLSIEELPLDKYPRIPVKRLEQQIFELEALAGRNAIDLRNVTAFKDLFAEIAKRKKPFNAPATKANVPKSSGKRGKFRSPVVQ